MSVERRCSRPPEGRADLKNSLRIVRALPEHGAAFFGRSLKVSIELEDEQPQDNLRLKAKRGGVIGGDEEVLLIHFELFPMHDPT